MILHPIDPVYDERSRVLILGSFPSVKSREMGFFYGHPQNRYWKVLARLMGTAVPMSVAERRAFLLEHRLAAWDVIGACDLINKIIEKELLDSTDRAFVVAKMCKADLLQEVHTRCRRLGDTGMTFAEWARCKRRTWPDVARGGEAKCRQYSPSC